MALAGKRLLVVDDSEELAQLLAAAAGARGAEAVVCSGGRAALAEVDARGADGAFVDLPLKDVRGDAFLLALKDRGVPCVAISGVLKGARYADMARHFGAIGFLEKPFDLDAAFRMLEAAVAAPEPEPEPELPALTPLPQFPVVTREEAAEASGVWEREAQPSPRPSPAGEFSRQTPVEPGENRAGGARARSPEGDPPPTSEIATASPYAYAYASSSSHSTPTPSPSPDPSPYPSPSPDPSPTLDFDPEHPDFDSIVFSPARPALDETLPGIPLPRRPLEGLAQPLPPTGSAAAARPPRPGLPPLPDGDLAASSVPRVLTALHVAQATGALTLTRDGVKKLVLFERGRPVFAVSNVPAERFGARAVRDGLVSAERLGALVDETGGKIPVAEALVARGLLDPDRRASIVRDQICEILWNAFPWRGGSYRLLVSPLTRRPPVAVDIFPGDLVLEGLRRTATLETLRAALPPALALAPGPDPAFELYDLDISAAEATLLAHADGTKSVADLALLTPLDERSALAFLQGCREIGLLVEVGRVLAGTRRIGFM